MTEMYKPAEMGDKEFANLSALVESSCGIKMPPGKKILLTSRLNKRLRKLGLATFGEYYAYIMTPEGRKAEFSNMVDAVTTNKTDFFREPHHFVFLIDEVLPQLLNDQRRSDPLQVWSAGCSTGEEVYTLGMVLDNYFQDNSGDYRIMGSDISQEALRTAMRAVYPERLIQPISHVFRKKYLLKGKKDRVGLYRLASEIRNKTEFRLLNLVEVPRFNLENAPDVIFCRNVIIYFDRPTQIALFSKFYHQLKPGGYLFIGHSETLNGISDQFVSAGVAVYRKPLDEDAD